MDLKDMEGLKGEETALVKDVGAGEEQNSTARTAPR